ncbi:hypothetical protein DVH24_031447 [Malus domestica]|uniref:Uncharacterized protein n=1 Tax=Malus domestica TaxID=3750 RepID=A0A498HFL6_MALDO|nr:hypothetical protein DVH24_031447 [Malus domestica]
MFKGWIENLIYQLSIAFWINPQRRKLITLKTLWKQALQRGGALQLQSDQKGGVPAGSEGLQSKKRNALMTSYVVVSTESLVFRMIYLIGSIAQTSALSGRSSCISDSFPILDFFHESRSSKCRKVDFFKRGLPSLLTLYCKGSTHLKIRFPDMKDVQIHGMELSSLDISGMRLVSLEVASSFRERTMEVVSPFSPPI